MISREVDLSRSKPRLSSTVSKVTLLTSEVVQSNAAQLKSPKKRATNHKNRRHLRVSPYFRTGISRINLLIFVLAILAAFLCFKAFSNKYSRQLHQICLQELEAMFPDATVHVGYVSQHLSGKLIVSDVWLADKKTRPHRPVFKAERVELAGKLELTDWLQNQVRLEAIDLHGVRVDIWPTQGGWSIEPAIPCRDSKKPKKSPPEVNFHDADVFLHKDGSKTADTVSLHKINGSAREILLQKGKGTIVAAKVKGKGSDVKSFELNAIFSPESHSWRVYGDVDGLQLSSALYSDLPVELSKHLKQLTGLTCVADAAFDVQQKPGQKMVVSLGGTLSQGRLQDRRLPYALEKLRGNFTYKNAKLQLRDVHAESDSAQLQLNVDIDGLALQSPMSIDARVQNLNLDHRLYQSLPPKLKEQWDRMQPSGLVSGRVWLEFDGQRWSPTLSANCSGVRIQPWLFPYPIENVHGLVTFENSPDRISAKRLTGLAEGQEVEGSVSLTKVENEFVGRLSCHAKGSISIDEVLLSALTPSDKSTTGAETFVRTLSPSGTLKLTSAEFWRDLPHETWHKKIDANIYNGRIKYDAFRYPIYDIRGRLYCSDDSWWLDRFEGRNDSGRIQCSGAWQTIAGSNIPFDLNFTALDVPIEDELRSALPAQAQFVWDELAPEGSIDIVNVRISRQPHSNKINNRVLIQEESESNNSTGRSLRLHPKAFPYRLSDVDCEIDYTPELVTIRRASANNGLSRISMRGICRPSRQQTWKANVEWLPQTRLWMESELLKALPKSIRESLVKIDLRGPISLLGTSEIEFGETRDNISSSWNCEIAIEEGQLGDGKQIGSMRGTLAMQGKSEGSNVNARGTINMDALMVLGIPVTRLRGPFALVGTDLYFGSRVYEIFPAASAAAVEHMTADALAGTVSLTGIGNLADNQGKFYVSSRLEDADLNMLLRDIGVDSASSEATVNATLEFNGVPWNTQTYDGYGNIHLSEAKLYELPFMIRLMNVASVDPSKSSHQTADINFTIVGNRIPIDVSCEDELLWLRGQGETNLHREIQLDLYSYVGRRSSVGKVASTILPDSRYATFMLIDIDGTLDNPIMQRRAFPQIENTFQQIFPELAAKRESNPILPWRR